MAAENGVWTIERDNGYGTYWASRFQRYGSQSPRVNGKLSLQSNAVVLSIHSAQPPRGQYPHFANDQATEVNFTRQQWARVIEPLRFKHATKFRDKVRGSAASMGITLTQWGQSHAMLTKRTTQAAGWLKASLQRIELMTPRQRRMWRKRIKRSAARSYRKGDPLASVVLEGEFGWKPLFSDCASAMEVLSQPLERDRWIKCKNVGSDQTDWIGFPGVINPNYNILRRYTANVLLTTSARVRLDNPNTSLASRLGLLNPVGVVWDAIPFSFLVNMFSNMGALMRNIQWEAGCTIMDVSATETTWVWSEYRAYGPENTGKSFRKEVLRSLTPPPYRPRFQLKFPDMNGETAMIMVSLIAQRFVKIAALARVPL